jgi:hypothetical protein
MKLILSAKADIFDDPKVIDLIQSWYGEQDQSSRDKLARLDWPDKMRQGPTKLYRASRLKDDDLYDLMQGKTVTIKYDISSITIMSAAVIFFIKLFRNSAFSIQPLLYHN